MKWFVVALLPLVLLADSPKKKTEKPPVQTGSVTIPADAEQIGPQVYRHKDKDGKTWIYRRTPFGISKYEEKATPKVEGETAPRAIPVKVTDLGESIRFEQETPMGARVWTKKKAELTPQEKTWVDEKLAPKSREK